MKRASMIIILLVLFISFSSYASNSLDDGLIEAAKDDKIQIVNEMLDKGADVNAKDKDGWTALLHATWYGNIDVVNQLIAKGTDVNAKNNDGETALMFAYENGYGEIVKLLKTAGALEMVLEEAKFKQNDINKCIVSRLSSLRGVTSVASDVKIENSGSFVSGNVVLGSAGSTDLPIETMLTASSITKEEINKVLGRSPSSYKVTISVDNSKVNNQANE